MLGRAKGLRLWRHPVRSSRETKPHTSVEYSRFARRSTASCSLNSGSTRAESCSRETRRRTKQPCMPSFSSLEAQHPFMSESNILDTVAASPGNCGPHSGAPQVHIQTEPEGSDTCIELPVDRCSLEWRGGEGQWRGYASHPKDTSCQASLGSSIAIRVCWNSDSRRSFVHKKLSLILSI